MTLSLFLPIQVSKQSFSLSHVILHITTYVILQMEGFLLLYYVLSSVVLQNVQHIRKQVGTPFLLHVAFIVCLHYGSD